MVTQFEGGKKARTLSIGEEKKVGRNYYSRKWFSVLKNRTPGGKLV